MFVAGLWQCLWFLESLRKAWGVEVAEGIPWFTIRTALFAGILIMSLMELQCSGCLLVMRTGLLYFVVDKEHTYTHQDVFSLLCLGFLLDSQCL